MRLESNLEANQLNHFQAFRFWFWVHYSSQGSSINQTESALYSVHSQNIGLKARSVLMNCMKKSQGLESPNSASYNIELAHHYSRSTSHRTTGSLRSLRGRIRTLKRTSSRATTLDLLLLQLSPITTIPNTYTSNLISTVYLFLVGLHSLWCIRDSGFWGLEASY